MLLEESMLMPDSPIVLAVPVLVGIRFAVAAREPRMVPAPNGLVSVPAHATGFPLESVQTILELPTETDVSLTHPVFTVLVLLL
jgi:hypothetical protein